MSPFSLLFALIVFTLLGICIGAISGLIPGIHVNLIAYAVVALQLTLSAFALGVFGFFQPTAEDVLLIVSSLIIGCLITHTFLEFIPSVFLGAPNDETALSVLPAHRLMLRGMGYEAVLCAALGCMGAVFLSLALLLPVRLVIGSPIFAYEKLTPYISYILLLVVVLLILNESRCNVNLGFKKCRVVGDIIDEAVEEKIVRISSLRSRLNEKVIVRGRVSRAASSQHLFIMDSSGETEVLLNRPCKIKLGNGILVSGTVKLMDGLDMHLSPKLFSILIFLLSGFIGLLLLGSHRIMSHNIYPIPLLNISSETVFMLPLFTGLFGFPGLLLSLLTKTKVPVQKTKNVSVKLSPKRKVRGIFTGTIAGGLVGFYPGIGASSGTVVARLVSGKDEEKESKKDMRGRKEFIIAVAGVDMANAVFSIVALFVLLKTRSGAMHAVYQITQESIFLWEPVTNVPLPLTLMLLSVIISSIIAFLLTLYFGRIYANLCNRIPYRKLVIGVIVFLTIMVFLFSGTMGLLVAGICLCIGMLPPLLGISRVHLMGCLLLPVILYFLELDTAVLRAMGLV